MTVEYVLATVVIVFGCLGALAFLNCELNRRAELKRNKYKELYNLECKKRMDEAFQFVAINAQKDEHITYLQRENQKLKERNDQLCKWKGKE